VPDLELNEREVLTVLRALHAGYDPDTGRALSEESMYKSETVVAALNHAISVLEKVNREIAEVHKPLNYRRRWTEKDENTLIAEYQNQASIFEIARLLGRSHAGIRYRLESLGLLENSCESKDNSNASGKASNLQDNDEVDLQRLNINQQLSMEQLEEILESCKINNEKTIQCDRVEFNSPLQLILENPSSSGYELAVEIDNYFSIAEDFITVMEDKSIVIDQSICDELTSELEELGASIMKDKSILFRRIEMEIRSLLELRNDLPTGRARQLNEARRKLDQNAPICVRPGCTSQMTIRESNGDFFWACRTFPSCWSKRQLSKAERDIIPD
jgi:hypothetical protein